MNKKILIIDDTEQDRKGMTVALKKAGYNEVSVAETGQEGVEAAKTFKPDVAIIDVVLQSADGLDVCREIRSIEGLKAKIIIITGHLDAVDAAKARICGADEIIEKRPGFENISQTIDQIN